MEGMRAWLRVVFVFWVCGCQYVEAVVIVLRVRACGFSGSCVWLAVFATLCSQMDIVGFRRRRRLCVFVCRMVGAVVVHAAAYVYMWVVLGESIGSCAERRIDEIRVQNAR